MEKKKKIKWLIKLPEKADIKVKVGDIVEDGQLLARVKMKRIESFDYSFIFAKLGPERLEELNDKFRKSMVSSGDLFCVSGGLFGNKVCFPITGKFLEIDEFGNLKIEKEEVDFKEIMAPVKSSVSKIEKGKIVLEFKASEIKGEAIIEGKVWGGVENEVINKNSELESELEGKILITDNLDNSFLLKAEVVGALGVISKIKGKEELKSKLPIIYLNEDNWMDLMNSVDKVGKILINSRAGRLLLVFK